jgi:pimeloyl-ACP methyl ester carboxylesterase
VQPARRATTAEAAAEDFIAKGASSPAMIAAFVETALASDPVRNDWRDLDQFAELDGSQLRVPTLLLQGEQDPYAPVAKQAEFFARIGSADKRWVILPGGDHAAHLESTGPLFGHALVEFLSRPGAR